MPKVYVIGNGFDLHHGMQTSYTSFCSYIWQHHEGLALEMEEYFDFKTNSNYLWCDFENDLGTYNYESFFNQHNDLDPMEEEFRPSHIYVLEDEIREDIGDLIENIRSAFSDWVDSIECPTLKSYQPKLLLLDKSSRYINFNYTGTLEDLYKIPAEQILYIHNKSGDDSEGVIFGHACVVDKKPKLSEIDEDDNCNRTPFTDSEDAARAAFFAFQKDTSSVIIDHSTFFNTLIGIDQVVVLGHSLGEVDWPYFHKIFEASPRAYWTFTYYGDAERIKMLEKIKAMLNLPEKNFRLVTLAEFNKSLTD